MTKEQRRIVNTWIAISAMVGAVFVFGSWVEEHPGWSKLVLLVLMGIAVLFDKPYTRPPDAIARAVERYPVLKLWYAICGVSVLVALVVTTHSQFRLDQEIGFRGIIAIFVALLGPLMYALERERFEQAADEE